MNKIYLDNAASTAINSEVLSEMLPYLTNNYGNAGAIHSFGRDALNALDLARERVAKSIGANVNEIYFTSGATESNNWALIGLAEQYSYRGKHIITSQIEHSSVLETCKYLEKHGFTVTYLPVDKYGMVNIADLLHAIQKDTILVSIMMANNEIGTIQNIKAIAQTVKEKGIIFHTDAVQALGAVNINVKEMMIDALTLSGHKIGGPKGIGALYIAKGINIEPMLHGGNQERGKRAGTENVAGAVGLGKACEIATRDIIINSKKLKKFRDSFVSKVVERIPYVHVNGHPIQRLAGNASISFGMVDGEALLLMLDMAGIAVSTGSACTSGVVEQSHVLGAIGLSQELAKGTIRFSFPRSITMEQVDFVVDVLCEAVDKLRAMSALKKNSIGEFSDVQ